MTDHNAPATASAEKKDSTADESAALAPPSAIETPEGKSSTGPDSCAASCRPGGLAVNSTPATDSTPEEKKDAHDPWKALGDAKESPDAPEKQEPEEKAPEKTPTDDLWTPSMAGASPAPESPPSGSSQDDDPFGLQEHAEPGTLPPFEPAASAKPGKKGKAAPSGGPFDGRMLGPVQRAEPKFRDEDGVWAPTPHTIFSRLFSALALFPLLPIVALLAVQVIFTLDTRALWYSDEVRYANAFQNMIQGGHWLVLQLNESMYPDKPPLFFWFLEGIRAAAGYILPGGIPGQAASPTLFSIGTALSALLLLLASHLLAVFVARVDRRTALAAGIVLLTGFFFSGLLHYLRMDILFAACITLSHVFLFHGWMRRSAGLLLLIGFLLAGTAVLIKGPLGFAFPLLTGIIFLLWQGRFGRFFRLDNLFALTMGLAVPGAWLALAWMNAGDPFLNNILHKQVLARALHTWHHAQPWYNYLITLPLIWLPWTLLLFFLPWGRLFGRDMRQAISASRTPEKAGLAYLWCAFVPGVILLSAVSIKLPIYCLPLFPPLAILCARAILRLSPLACKCMQWLLAFILFALAVLLLTAPVLPKTLLPIPVLPEGTLILGGICLVAACALGFLATPRRAEGMLLIFALFMAGFSYPAWSVSAPSLDVFMSPKAQALVIKKYREAGYFPASYKVYGGTYSYYAGVVRDCEEWKEALDLAAKHPKMILALRAKDWDGMKDKPEGFVQVNRQTIAERDYVLVARPPLEGDAPAARPQIPAKEQAAPAADAKPETPAKPESAVQPAPEAGTTPAQSPAQAPAQSPAEPKTDTPAKPETPAGPVPPVAPQPAPAPSAPAGTAPAPAEAAPPAKAAPSAGGA